MTEEEIREVYEELKKQQLGWASLQAFYLRYLAVHKEENENDSD
jgi:hypothetical protein